MKYIKVAWLHDCPDDPHLLYCELDDERWEVRKVELFKDGSKGWADATTEVGSTGLSETAIPELAEIASDEQFTPLEIEAEEFEQVWRQRFDSAVTSPRPTREVRSDG